MFAYYIVETGKYSHSFENQVTCYREARLVSAIHRCEIYIVDMKTAEVIDIFCEGLSIE